MKMKFFCLYDKLSLEYNPPFCSANDDSAKFLYTQFVENARKEGKKEMLIPDLYSYGWTFNSETGEVCTIKREADLFPKFLMRSSEVEGEKKDG